MRLNPAQRLALHDLYATIARTQAATPEQRALAGYRCREIAPMSIEDMIKATFGFPARPA